MACDEGLVQRIREILQDDPEVQEIPLFGGVAFLVNGNMSCGVHKDDLIVRLEPEGHASALIEPFTRSFDITGRPMRGWVTVTRDGCEDDANLSRWVRRAVGFAQTLPAKDRNAARPTAAKPLTKRRPRTRRTKTKP